MELWKWWRLASFNFGHYSLEHLRIYRYSFATSGTSQPLQRPLHPSFDMSRHLTTLRHPSTVGEEEGLGTPAILVLAGVRG